MVKRTRAIISPKSLPKSDTWALTLTYNPSLIGVIGSGPREDGETEIGYWLGRSFWGAGLMTEAAGAVVARAFQSSTLERIVSGHFAHNPSSGRVLAKMGFRMIGRSERVCAASDSVVPPRGTGPHRPPVASG